MSAYGKRHATDLDARVGIVTGTAATTETAEEGFVVGDRVNTAARIQSIAPPGCCYVDESTKRATDASIAYSDAGSHPLKGKAEPVQLHRALRVVAGVGGALKSEGLEAPFVGRDRELRLVKDLFHASADENRAHLVSVTGIAGIGKSRLAWEFYKYLDGLSDLFRWHRGRCLSYGEGVAYWALAEMVRSRAGILEGGGRGFGSGQAARRGRRARHRSGGTPLGRTPPRASSRARGTHRPGQGGPVRRLAAVLRTHVRGPRPS